MDSDGSIHDYGYDCHFPEIYAEDLTIDTRYVDPTWRAVYLLPNWNGNYFEKQLSSYWAQSYIVNRFQFINTDHMVSQPRLEAITNTNTEYTITTSFVTTYVKATLGGSSREDVSEKLFRGETVETEKSVNFEIRPNTSCTTSLTVTMGGNTLASIDTLSDTYTQTYSAAGEYTVTIECVNTGSGNIGTATLKFTIKASSA